MLAKLTLYDGTVYRIASKTIDTSDGIYQGRIKDELSIESSMGEAGNAPSSINLTILNYDNFIPRSKDLWASELLLTNSNGVSWKGKVNFCNFDADGNLYITASEKTAPELELQLPDEVRQVYTVDEDFHQSSVTMTIPLVVGGTHSNPITLPTILIDKTRGIYLICVGEIREIVAVYNGSEVLPRSAYIPYRGWSTQEENPGFAYVQIEEPYRTNSDGSYAEINVDVVGLKLGEHTAEECRNGARFLYYFLTTPSQGVNGWGCGIDPSEIDQTSFNTAMTLCDQFNFKLDGIMWLRQSAQSWIDQICQSFHGKYSINANGKRSLFVDYAGNASKKTFNAKNMKVERFGKNSYTSVVYNKGILSYDYNPITGLFMQSAQYENADSIAQIGEQKFVGESYLISDAHTALATLEYVCKRSQSSAEAIEFSTDDVVTELRAGDIITISRPDIDISGNYQIQSISTTDYQSQISAQKFDTSVFSVTGSTNTVNWGNDKDITPALTPAQATNLLLSTGFDINQDGTGNPYVIGTFTVPEGGWLAAAVQYGIGTNPTNYTELALITEGRFKIQPVNVGTVYTIRVRMITSTGHSDYITGQITSTGDTVSPDIPTIVLNSTDKTVIVKCAIDNPPSDMGGFQIWRKKHTEEVFTLVGNVAANFGYASFPDHVETFVEYDYKAKSYDRSGNLSGFSQVVSITPTGLEATELAATAIKIPTGSILYINAKGSTTESIKTANGVIDGSGYGHHGKADNTVAISNDVDFGPCFDFAGAGGITMPNLDISEGMTYIFKVKNLGVNEGTAYSQIFRHYKTSNGIIVRIRPANNYADIQIYNNSSSALTSNVAIPSDINIFTFAFAVDSSGSAIYINGEKKAESTAVKLLAAITDVPLTINKTTTKSGLFNDFRIYKRRLSDTEIKSINMIPQESMFHAVTADLIGANAVKAIHLDAESVTANAVGTNEIITNTANIKDATITDAKISGTLGANRIEANSITSDKISVVGRPAGCSLWLSAVGAKSYANGTLIPDLSGNDRGFKLNGTWNTINNNDSRGWHWGGTATGVTRSITNTKAMTFNASNWTIGTRLRLENIDTNNYYYLWDFTSNGSSDVNRFLVRIVKTTGKIEFASYDANGAGSVVDTGLSITRALWYNLFVVCTGGTTLRFYLARDEVAPTEATSFTIPARAALTCAVGNFVIGNQKSKGSAYEWVGYLGNIQWWNAKALPLSNIQYLCKTTTDTESGQITTDRIATDAIKSRNYAYSSGDFSTAGTFLDLANGAITSQNFCIKSDGSAFFKGNVSADSGYIGNFTISGGALVANNTFGQGLNSIELKGGGVSSRGGATYDNVSRYDAFEIHNINYSTATAITDEYHSTIGPGTLSVRYYKSSSAYGYFDINANAVGDVYSTSILYIQQDTTTKFGLGVKGKAYCSSGAWSGSDKNTKSQIKQESVINRLKQIELASWKYDQDKIDGKKTNKGTNGQPKHYGPMAQEFNAVFGTSDGASDSICYTDTIGVALRAIQELAQQVDDLKRQTRLYKRILNITNEQIAEERDKTAIRKIEIAKARQAKRAIKEHESPIDLEEVEDVEINTADSDDANA